MILNIVSMLRRTFRDPQGAARDLIGLKLSSETCSTAAALVAVLETMGLMLALLLVPAGDAKVFSLLADPWLGLPLQFAALILLAGVMILAGRFLGGKGQFLDALVLVAWIEFVMVLAQVAQLLTMFVLPLGSLLISLGSLAMFIWLLVHFTAALHAIAPLGRVLLAVVGAGVGLILLLAIVFAVFGIMPDPMGM